MPSGVKKGSIRLRKCVSIYRYKCYNIIIIITIIIVIIIIYVVFSKNYTSSFLLTTIEEIENARMTCHCSTTCENVEFFTEQSMAVFPDLTTKRLLEDKGYSFEYAKYVIDKGLHLSLIEVCNR